MPGVIVFDVNETMLDISALRPFFERTFSDGDMLQLWFLQVLQYSLVSTVAGPYHDFGKIAMGVLEMIATAKGVSITPSNRTDLADRMHALPPHPDVVASLTQLQAAGVRMATLSNSSPASIKRQLDFAGLTPFFEKTLSVEPVKRFKPAPETYHYAAAELAIKPQQMTLVAAHAWDVAGAMEAGCKTAFVARAGHVPLPLYPKPTVAGRDLHEIAEKIMSRAV